MPVSQTGIGSMFFSEDFCDFPGQNPILKSDLDTFRPSY